MLRPVTARFRSRSYAYTVTQNLFQSRIWKTFNLYLNAGLLVKEQLLPMLNILGWTWCGDQGPPSSKESTD